jgi:hypothetical protein
VPEPEQDDLADLIVVPGPEAERAREPELERIAEVIPIVEPRPGPEVEPEPEDLPDFIVVPGREPPGAEAGPSLPPPANLGFPPVTDLVLERDAAERERGGETQGFPHAQPEHERPSAKERRRRSSHEPGDEGEETGWMLGLSNRLSAYSLSEDAARPGGAEPDERNGDEPPEA